MKITNPNFILQIIINRINPKKTNNKLFYGKRQNEEKVVYFK